MTGLAKNLDISEAIWSLLSLRKYLLPSVFCVSAALFPNGSFAGNFDGLPDGGKVDYGKVIIKKNNNQMEINQKSQKAIIEWENFDLDEAASNLYKTFRLIKKKGYKKIQIGKIPNIGTGIAINDRIERSSKS